MGGSLPLGCALTSSYPALWPRRTRSTSTLSHPRRPTRTLAGTCDHGVAASPNNCRVTARGMSGEARIVAIDTAQIEALGVVMKGGSGDGHLAGPARQQIAHHPTHGAPRSQHVPCGSEPCWVGP